MQSSSATLTKNGFSLERGLDLRLEQKSARLALKWGLLSFFFFLVLFYDIQRFQFCHRPKWLFYIECLAALYLSFMILVYFVKYVKYLFRNPLKGTQEQRQLLTFESNDASFEVPKLTAVKATINKVLTRQRPKKVLLNWLSSLNDSASNTSYNRKTPPPRQHSPVPQDDRCSPQYSPSYVNNNVSWNTSGYMNNSTLNGSVQSSTNTSFPSPYFKYARDDFIKDERSLHSFLSRAADNETSFLNSSDIGRSFSNGNVNSFWTYYNTAAHLLKTSMYQLAPVMPLSSKSSEPNLANSFNAFDANPEMIKHISHEKLSDYVANLRRWLAATILHRLVKEIRGINDSFKERGITDMEIGSIGLDRLRKTIKNQQFVTQYMPMLPLIVPFLEISNNQEYLVQRIRELAAGSCIADYRWNSGSSFKGVKWDEYLPTDSSILFHLFCVYFDSQLMPLPQGGGRPFFSRYVILDQEKRSTEDTVALVNNKANCAILCTNPLQPRFNFIRDKKIHSSVYDRNNLFHVIIQFLMYMNETQDGFLEGVNLGRSGINMLCVIEDKK